MKWQKLGLLFCPESLHPKLMSHAANPLPMLLEDDTYRIFYSGRDVNNRSSVGFVDIDIVKREIIHINKNPVFEFGPEGSFYSHGVSIGNCYEANGVRYMLFMGWQYPENGHWRGDIGRLIVNDDWSLSLESEKPFIGSDAIDPISLSYPWVISNNSGGFHMWYGSTVNWDAGNGEMLHVIHYAESNDGHHWQKSGQCVPAILGQAQAFSHPCVIDNNHGGYDMWFSYRSGTGETYRIGYASCSDSTKSGNTNNANAKNLHAQEWNLHLNEAGIHVSETGWDSEMIEYPFVFDHKNERYMLYNGNGNGKSGFGLAVLKNNV